MRIHSYNRRSFIKRSAVAAAGLSFGPSLVRGASPNEKLNIGIIGVANQGNYDMSNVAGENIVALCDIDDHYLEAAGARFPKAKTYSDYRRLLDQKDIDAVVIATPDHTHAIITVAALKSGRHVYCEKPLTHTLSECRKVMETARKAKRVTQIGTQIHAGNNYRRVVELVQSDAIGPIHEVHVWVNATYGGKDVPKETPPVPANIHYDQWLGPVAYRPYSPEYLPFNWRHWWAFGGGALADMGCHYIDLPHWALGLRTPLTAQVVDGPPVHTESTPVWLIVKYEYQLPKNDKRLNLLWYHGGKKPAHEVLAPEIADKWPSGVLFMGSKGVLLADYDRHVLLPEKEFAGFKRPGPFIKDSIGHHAEWVRACKTGEPTMCNFEYSGALTESVLLGNLAYRVGKRIEWDSQRLHAKGCPEAEQFIQHHYRKGWTI